MHYTLLIACVLVAFFLGAILSGFLVSCYCGRSAAQRARRLGKDPEASLSHALSLRSLSKLNGLLDTRSKVGVAQESERLRPPGNLSFCVSSLLQEDKPDVSKLYSSFIPNGHSEPHVRSNGLVAADGELSLSQVSRHAGRHLHRSSERLGFDVSFDALMFLRVTGGW